MIKRLWMVAPLALAVLLSACYPGKVLRPIPPAVEFAPPQNPAVTAVEKVVTLVPGEDQVSSTATPSPTRRAIDDKAQAEAIANLRALTGLPQLELAIRALDRSPNATNYPAFLFVDPLGNSYYVSQDTLLPIEFTQERPSQDLGSAKTADELRAIAEQLAKTHSKKFEALSGRLTYTEGGKVGNHFYRWELSGTNVGGMTAIFQVGLREDGSLFAYLNSLDLLP